jgi:cytochrome c oxidase subunit 3
MKKFMKVFIQKLFNLYIRIGMSLFILTEIMFFFSFFFAFFYLSLTPSIMIAIGMASRFNKHTRCIGIALLNTGILLTSGIAITLSHHELRKGKKLSLSIIYLIICILLAFIFLLGQFIEYLQSPFAYF